MNVITLDNSTPLDFEGQNLATKLLGRPLDVLCSYLFRTRYPSILECDCTYFGRDRHAAYREALENLTLRKIEQKCPDKQEKIKLCSLGAGGCFQELVIVNDLLDAKYENIDLTVIDKSYGGAASCPTGLSYMLEAPRADAPPVVEQFESCIKTELLPQYPSAHIEVSKKSNFEKYLKKIEKGKEQCPDAFLLIDLQGDYTDEGPPLHEYALSLLAKNKSISEEALFIYTYFKQKQEGCMGDGVCIDACLSKKFYKLRQIFAKSLPTFEYSGYTFEKSGRACWTYEFIDGQFQHTKVEEGK